MIARAEFATDRQARTEQYDLKPEERGIIPLSDLPNWMVIPLSPATCCSLGR
jgi:hypothetical protein